MSENYDNNTQAQNLDELDSIKVQVHSNVDNLYIGRIISMKADYAKTTLHTSKEMSYDTEGLVFNSFIYTAANWAAQVAINKEFLITIGSRVNFLSPAKVGDVVEFEANAFFNESKKQEVKVFGSINEIRVFEGSFIIIALEEHIFKMQKKQMEKQAKESLQNNSNA